MPNNFPAAVLWDMDGTLIDSEPYWLLSESRLATDYGSSWTHENGLELVGKSLYDSSAIIKERLSIKDLGIQEIIDRLTDEVVAELHKKLPWRPGALELLMSLKQAGIKTALVTMSMRRMAMAVVNQIPFEAFDAVIAGDDVILGKPDPEPYLKAAAILGVEPKDCIALEDSVTGLRSAEAAGTLAVGIPNIVPIPPSPGRVLVPTLLDLNADNIGELRNRV
jgi:HAD superfamily hydrolase (TIGR01509 family)